VVEGRPFSRKIDLSRYREGESCEKPES
jgi:hypothetical protein